MPNLLWIVFVFFRKTNYKYTRCPFENSSATYQIQPSHHHRLGGLYVKRYPGYYLFHKSKRSTLHFLLQNESKRYQLNFLLQDFYCTKRWNRITRLKRNHHTPLRHSMSQNGSDSSIFSIKNEDEEVLIFFRLYFDRFSSLFGRLLIWFLWYNHQKRLYLFCISKSI